MGVTDEEPEDPSPDLESLSPEMRAVLESAARLQELVPDAVLVGEAAAAMHAAHRDLYSHDHEVVDLQERFDLILEALESEGEWVTQRVRPRTVILGRLGEIEAGVRQLVRSRPLETIEVTLPPEQTLRVPTAEEALRIKGFLLVARNQTRDYLDLAALADHYEVDAAASVLTRIDGYYADSYREGHAVASQLARQLGDPRPSDVSMTRQLGSYRNLAPRWHDWSEVRDVCRELAAAMVEVGV